MLFTKIWTAFLAVLATACLAGMYLLSTGSSGGFTAADETAVRAVTEAGMAALASDINSSPVSLGPSLLSDTRLKEALDRPAVPPPEEDGLQPETLQDVFSTVANEGLLNEHHLMSMAIVDKDGTILAQTGLAPELFTELMTMPAFDTALGNEEAKLMSATLKDELHAVKLSRPLPDGSERRLVTIRAVDLAGGSFFRRVVGTENPSGLVRGGQVLGEALGGADPASLVSLVSDNLDSIPSEGASGKVFEVGSGGDVRIGSAARVPGPAGKGDKGTFFVVLSAHNLASTEQDMMPALKAAVEAGALGEVPWLQVLGLLVIAIVLTFYGSHAEYNAPLRRMTAEFNGITEGRQHELYHDTYGGELGRLGRAATTAMEALRVSWENELLDSDAELSDGSTRRRTRSTRSLRAVPKRRSREHQSLEDEFAPRSEPEPDGLPDAIDLPSADAGAPIERHAAAEAPVLDGPPAPAPAFHDELTASPGLALNDSSDSVSLDDVVGGADDREGYYRRIYDEFVETKIACGEATEGFTYEKFAKKLRKQSDTLLARPEVTDVQFSVYVKDGKAALRAKVIKG